MVGKGLPSPAQDCLQKTPLFIRLDLGVQVP